MPEAVPPGAAPAARPAPGPEPDRRDPADAPAPGAADACACPLCGQAVAGGTTHGSLAMLVARQEEALRKMQTPRKSWWERMPVVVGVLGLLFTILYQLNQLADHRAEQARAEDARRLELMSKFFPHLISNAPAAQRGAVVALDLLADSTLAAAAALVAPSEAAASALREVRMNPVSLDDAGYVDGVARRLPSLRPITSPNAPAPAGIPDTPP
jgi:hypothetical protein